MTRIEQIKEKLNETLQPSECLLTDDSDLHKGHVGAASGGGHYTLRIVSSHFEGKNRINRHRLVYDAVGEMMKGEIHALSILALSPSELSQGESSK